MRRLVAVRVAWRTVGGARGHYLAGRRSGRCNWVAVVTCTDFTWRVSDGNENVELCEGGVGLEICEVDVAHAGEHTCAMAKFINSYIVYGIYKTQGSHTYRLLSHKAY